jgi:hypothetical protein
LRGALRADCASLPRSSAGTLLIDGKAFNASARGRSVVRDDERRAD